MDIRELVQAMDRRGKHIRGTGVWRENRELLVIACMACGREWFCWSPPPANWWLEVGRDCEHCGDAGDMDAVSGGARR
ncbi:DNA polymerase gamma [Thermaerobacter marianensis DSM 12885]|uniref:DNA polymerase gamma n=1 Tax=Thermaerobacter marianensis (strain ATCC 700841 / DSM 12885 / JCM 10246 / 7p75a) TaxID=644966 RepID=E6SKG3_THEM7|nr:DNA polymerase gamma [Thermaerobacter marianensis DSM 12885]